MNTVIILFVFILGARPRKPFESQLFELSLRQRIGSMVSRTRLNLRRLQFSLHACHFLDRVHRIFQLLCLSKNCMYSIQTGVKTGVLLLEGIKMVVDVKEKLDIWRYSRACSKVLIIFFLYNLLSILYHATILCCVLIFTPQIAIIFRYSAARKPDSCL